MMANITEPSAHHLRMIVLESIDYLVETGKYPNKRQACKYIYSQVENKYIKTGFKHSNFENFYENVLKYEAQNSVEKKGITYLFPKD